MAKSGDNTSAIQAIDAAAARYGIDPTTLLTIAYLETGGTYDPSAKNKSSSASGLFQFTNRTGKEYGLSGGDRLDAGKSADAAARLLLANQEYLRQALGRDPTTGELYLAHQQGAYGASQILTSPTGSNAVTTLGREAVALNVPRLPGENAREFNDRISRMTVGDFSKVWTDKAEQVATTRLPPGYIPGVGTLRDVQANPTTQGGYASGKGLTGTSPVSSFFGVAPGPRNTRSDAVNARQAQINRTAPISPAMPQYRTSNTPVPVPRMATRGGPTPNAVEQPTLPSYLTLQNVVAPSTTSPTGGVVTNAQLQAIRNVPAGVAPQAQFDGYNLARSGTTTPAAMAVTPRLTGAGAVQMPATVAAARDPIGAGASYEALRSFANPGMTSSGNTVYVRPDGTSTPAVTRTGSPTGQPSPGYMPGSPAPVVPSIRSGSAAARGTSTYSPIPGVTPSPTNGSNNARLATGAQQAAMRAGSAGVGSGGTKTVMKPTTVTKTIMVPNPAWGKVNPAAVSKLQSIHDKEEGRIMAAQVSNVPKMIPKVVTQTVMKPVVITVRGGNNSSAAPRTQIVTPPPPPRQTPVQQLQAQGMSPEQAYNQANANAAQRAASRAGTTTSKTSLTSNGNPGWWGS